MPSLYVKPWTELHKLSEKISKWPLYSHCRYLQGIKGDVDEHRFFSEASGSLRGLGMDSTADSWRLLPSRVSSFPPAKQRSSGIWQSHFPQVQGLQDLEAASLASAIPKQQQHCFFGNDIGSSETVKQEGQPLRPFFDEWPKTRDSWSDLDDDRSNRSSFSTTQLSISIPMTSSDFSATSSRSPNG